ncbi:hypothetical protein GCM10010363_08040 [Streptomyces omiyaensis]|uniref:hypothetical protein n=1 Tax=Streptomyces omiyaensis TaxID=68247 RepID=UPI0016746B39|nr:hypothetical protein [Streptomyces omiyaensis]GGY29927.1 hypothetical protein GCM10010363_08040 [Streptomyces omiyaensis]
MADEGTAKQQRARESVRIEFVPKELMPDGHIVVPINAPGTLVWGVLEGQMTDDLRDEMNRCLQHIIGSGLWQQNWDDGETPPSHPH